MSKMDKLKKDYENIEIPEELDRVVKSFPPRSENKTEKETSLFSGAVLLELQQLQLFSSVASM